MASEIGKKVKVLVTGGAGFIGSHIVDLFIARDMNVVVVDNLSTGNINNLNVKAGFYQCDILSEAFEHVMAKEKPDYVCHHAAQVSVANSTKDPEIDAEINITGTLRVIKLCLLHNVAGLIFASSGGTVYGDLKNKNKNLSALENLPLLPLSPYGISKVTAEMYLRYFHYEEGLKYIALRYGNVFGPRQRPDGDAGVISIFANKMLKKEELTIHGDGNYFRDYVFVGDVAEVNYKAIQKMQYINGNKYLINGFNSYNIGTNEGTNVNSLFCTLRDIIGYDGFPSYDAARKGDIRLSVLNNKRAFKILGWKPKISFNEGLMLTVSWLACENNGRIF